MLPSWIAIAVCLATFLLGFGLGACLISVFDAKNVGRLEDLRAENRRLRSRLNVITEDVAK